MRDLGDALNGGLEARERELAHLAPSTADLDRMRHTVRRRKVRRYALQGVAAVAVIAALGGAGWWGTHRPAPMPAITPTPAVTSVGPTIVPSASPGPTTDPTGPPATPVVRPGLPNALPAPDGLLNRMGAGWLLAIYYSYQGSTPAAEAVLAASPDGTLYHLLDLPTDRQLRLLDWNVGDPRARVLLGDWREGRDYGTAGWLDLRTGAFEQDDPRDVLDTSNPMYYVPGLGGGSEMWVMEDMGGGPDRLYVTTSTGEPREVGDVGGASQAFVSPSGEQVVALDYWASSQIVVLRVADGRRTEMALGSPSEQCSIRGWIDDESLLGFCAMDDPDGKALITDLSPRLVRADVTTGTVTNVRSLTVGDPYSGYLMSGARAHGVVFAASKIREGELSAAFVWDDVCLGDGVWRWSEAGLQQLWRGADGDCAAVVSVAADSAGDRVFFDVVDTMTLQVAAKEIYAIDPDGTVRVVVPALSDPENWATDVSWIPVG